MLRRSLTEQTHPNNKGPARVSPKEDESIYPHEMKQGEFHQMGTDSQTFRRLEDFILNRMRMSHIYQPVMLQTLLQKGGSASVSEIASSISAHDPSQIEYYVPITKNMVGRVLTGHRITETEKDGNRIKGFRLTAFDKLREGEVAQLIAICQQKLEQYRQDRGQKIWSHRRKSSRHIPGTLKYEVLKRAKFRCELCGISAQEKALEVDHIVPRNHGGTNDLSNLQALCFSCNAMKRDRDDTDFRGISKLYEVRENGCPFCDVTPKRIVAENELGYAIKDSYPVTPGHLLIIPKRHVEGYFDLFQPELNALAQLLNEQKDAIGTADQSVTGFNTGTNSGEDAGQTIMHCHVHLIPRRKGDTENPRGGVRGVMPEKRSY